MTEQLIPKDGDDETRDLVARHNRSIKRMLRAVTVAYVAAFVMSAVAVFAAVSASQQATEAAVRDSERKWCALLVPLDATYQASPPPTETGRKFAVTIHRLRLDFGC
jgi:hypothetical protein